MTELLADFLTLYWELRNVYTIQSSRKKFLITTIVVIRNYYNIIIHYNVLPRINSIPDPIQNISLMYPPSQCYRFIIDIYYFYIQIFIGMPLMSVIDSKRYYLCDLHINHALHSNLITIRQHFQYIHRDRNI